MAETTTQSMTQSILRIALLRHTFLRYPVYREIFSALADSLSQSGASVREVDTVAEVSADRDDLLLIVGAPVFVEGLQSKIKALRSRAGRRVLVFLWHLEHLPDLETPAPVLWAMQMKSRVDALRRGKSSGSRAANYDAIRGGVSRGIFDHVFVFTPRKALFLKRHGVTSEYLPCGHHPIWGTPEAGERDVDVLFLGEVLKDRRGAIVRTVQEELSREGVAVKTMYDFNPIGLWGEERNALLRRTKIYLSVYRFPADFSGLRFSLGMGNGALVVSEPVSDPYPFVPGQHFVETPVPELARTTLKYLRDEEARHKIIQQATALLTSEYTLRASAERIIARALEFRRPPDQV